MPGGDGRLRYRPISAARLGVSGLAQSRFGGNRELSHHRFDGRFIPKRSGRLGLGIGPGVDCLRRARDEGFFTLGFVSRPQDASAFAEAGCDALVLHLGLTPDFAPRPLATAFEDTWTKYMTAFGSEAPLLLLNGEHLIDAEDHAAWTSSVRDRAGLFAMGGLERIDALRALTRKGAVGA
jgi:predicted TIM-barrel enzyme